jgi:hypothetical protein
MREALVRDVRKKRGWGHTHPHTLFPTHTHALSFIRLLAGSHLVGDR